MIKALDDLSIAELRRELKERQLNPKGKKELRERLESWMVDNGFDVDDYEFVDPCLKQISSDIKKSSGTLEVFDELLFEKYFRN